MPASEIIEFCNTVRDRSKENWNAFNLLLQNGNYGVAIGLLRQEVDSLVRVAYLNSFNTNFNEQERLIHDFLNGERWHRISANGKKQWITDKEMVNLEGGWVRIVYNFGCKLIHLSDYHSYNRNDPFQKINRIEKGEIIDYLNFYHQYPFADISMEKFVPYLPKVMKKIIDNAGYYVRGIEENIRQQNDSNT
ncbi:MAG: hypothetical protein M3384_18300 [Acidobacteriota bacterium]|nr:hypothetical protein [Acidobacteriota bacterium]